MNVKVSDPISVFRKLHESGCFVIPNPWDVGSAKYLAQLGFKALATTSAGLAFSKGFPDAIGVVSLHETLAHIREIVSASPLPVNADFQNGFSDEPEDVAANVSLCVKTGVAGLSIEDATGRNSGPLYERSLAVERIAAARAAINATQNPVVLTARCEAWLVGDPNPFRTAIERLVAYAEAGADCLFAPGVRDPNQIEALVKAVSPKPVNVIMSSAIPGFSVPLLSELGVRRISVGSALARTAWTAFMNAAKSIAETGSFEVLSKATTFAEMNKIFRETS